DFTAKDFRTWAGTVLAARALRELAAFDSNTEAKKNIVLRAIESVAERLGNTRTVCRKCYVHPAILDAYVDGTLLETLHQRAAGGVTVANRIAFVSASSSARRRSLRSATRGTVFESPKSVAVAGACARTYAAASAGTR